MSWHVQDDTIDAYVAGRIDEASAFSLEAHVLECPACRDAVSTRADDGLHGRVWDRIRLAIDRPRLGLVERALCRVGLPEHVARLLLASPALRAPWLLAVAISLAFAALATRTIANDPVPFLVLAPLVPLAGVGAAFGASSDPLWEIGLSSPVGGFRLMLIRTTSVLVTSIVLAGAAALTVPGGGWVAAAWLLPSLALTVLTLAVSTTSVPAATAAGVVGAVWLAAVLLIERSLQDPSVAFGATAQILFAVVATVSALVVVGRHTSFERPSSI